MDMAKPYVVPTTETLKYDYRRNRANKSNAHHWLSNTSQYKHLHCLLSFRVNLWHPIQSPIRIDA